MAIEEMELLDMTFDKKYLKEVLCQLKETKYFYPQPATKIVNNVKDVFTMTPDEDYKNMLDELKELAEHVKLDTSSVKAAIILFIISQSSGVCLLAYLFSCRNILNEFTDE